MYRYPSVPTTSDTLIINHYYPEQTGYPACTSVQEERYGRGDTNLGTNYGANNLGDNNRTNIRHDSHDIDNSDNSSNVDNSERIKNIENWRDGARTNNSKQVYISKHKHSGGAFCPFDHIVAFNGHSDGSGRYRDDRYASNREVSQSNRRADYPRAPQ
ncbi:hypothetical protein SISSUDRAFT_405936 [Sistotremastrum suecicum HHB10207 ss-3]|uniref:Uncharacterized protein n=1 Tax=Sistotremastrum suecicum HHB10207 ss-3 TaxID=1314776 RepID=A0A165YQZ1_9AGAM|nr:hypothetical protein SISSUDRAFT_405936 [Sistotremastrum suecicum HHB10207 ss-3]